MNILSVVIALVGIFLVSLGYWLEAEKRAAQRVAERHEIARLRRHADMETGLVQKGDLAGWYGEYSPPPALWGVGIRNVSEKSAQEL